MDYNKTKKNYYYVNILEEDNYVFLADSWDTVFMFLITYYEGKNTDQQKRIIKNIKDLSDKVYMLKKFLDVDISFISILENPLCVDCDCIKELDIDGDEIR